MIKLNNTRCWLSGGRLHILSMPDISSEASNVLFCASLLLAPGFCFAGEGFTGDENNPVISSRPFSSSLPCGRVTPVRLRSISGNS